MSAAASDAVAAIGDFMAGGDKQLAELVMTCAFAIATGQPTVTLSVRGMRPAGFPRGELLSVGTNGAKNYAVNPVKALAWVHGMTMAARA